MLRIMLSPKITIGVFFVENSFLEIEDFLPYKCYFEGDYSLLRKAFEICSVVVGSFSIHGMRCRQV